MTGLLHDEELYSTFNYVAFFFFVCDGSLAFHYTVIVVWIYNKHFLVGELRDA